MTQTETDEEAMRVGLDKVVDLIEQASLSVSKLMASVCRLLIVILLMTLTIMQDSVPKFLRDPRYQGIIREHQIDMNLAQRALSPVPSPSLPSTSSMDKTPSRSNTSRGSST